MKEFKINIQIGGRGYGKAYHLLDRYIRSSEIFNNKYKNKYRIDVFLDLCFLNIYVRNLKTNKTCVYNVLNHLIKDLSIKELVKAYEELI